ncbi:Vacuolar membrane antiporter with Ca2+/H+ and K+/H+ exchange activity, variant 2 [Metarhizium acridum]|uniref:Vacuolar calcium ion transporter n=2 Tax=Metarhizium acridum TaxID=92637 RepID=E9DYD5_METAQ|nr:calcium/proton exchanger [Metarhizium acridum CQMa 102]EFY91205.1 calcium/proton exchanger [Metarhizium acridum CQMa 102]KAG8406929.1 Vacuolar membrane antiporter with Ca2+/H+ and K+/H+ exchange activity, variant 2 [Metarhizium acridum]KAG8423707.1 Vacuolar membrane antiporter with Ca2+/H+ and K+/H+ exchange activity, variant 2 [Metarhizium acridum]
MSHRSYRNADEHTPLINGESASSAQAGNHTQHQPKTGLRTFLLDTQYTPGNDSESIAVRGAAYTWHVTKVTLLSGYVNFLLVMVPIGIVAGALNWNPTAVFTINFFAIIPLAAVLSFATEMLASKLGQAMGGLLNATFGNAVELIVSIVALKDGQIVVVQSSMLGSILSNLLLVMGMCFLFGGLVHRGTNGDGREQSFSAAVAQTTCSLMTLSSASLVIPAALYAVLSQNGSQDKNSSILILSRGTAIVLLLLYVMYLVFQLRTHSNLFDEETQQEGDAEEEASIGPVAAAIVLVVVTVLVAICAEYLVGSIDDIVESANISKAFIGLILIPIVGNAAEHVTAVVVALRDKMDLAMAVAIGSSIQIALGVTPFLVIVGWIIGQPMSLHFETFQTVAFAVSVLVVTYTVQDGKSNYLEGAMLLGLYLIIAVAFYATPSDAFDGSFAQLLGNSS